MVSIRSRNQFCRIFILAILAYEAAGCLLGGVLLMITPNGHTMNMPVRIMHGVFADFWIPGMLLFVLGIINTTAFFVNVRKSPFYHFYTFLAIGGLLGWFWIEIAILRQLHWLHLMWGGPVVAAAAAELFIYPWTQETKRKLLLLCGIVASVLYVVINIITPALWPAYQLTSQTVSELSAIGTPTRFVWTTLCVPYTLLMIAFAFGVLLSAANNKQLKIAGNLLLAYGLLGILWPFASMHQRVVLATGGGTISDRLHLAVGGLTELLYILALFFTAYAMKKWFRLYSLITFVILVIFGSLTFWAAPGVASNQPTPLLGIWERINIGIFLLWVVIFSLKLISNDSNAQNSITDKHHKSVLQHQNTES